MSKSSPPFFSSLAHHAADPFRLLVESVVDYAIYMVDPAGNIASWNPGAERLYGYRAEEIVGQPFATVVSPDALRTNEPPRNWDAVLSSGHLEIETQRLRKDGTRFWAIVTVSVLRDHFGAQAGFSVVTRDITERREAATSLREAHDLSDAMLTSLPGVFFVYDADRHFVRWNKRLESVSGYSAAELATLPLFDLVAPLGDGSVAAQSDEAFDEGPREIESDLITKAGDRLTYLFNGIGIELGGRRCLLRMGIDVRAQRAAREDLRRTTTLLRAVIEGTPDTISVKDNAGKYLLVNTAGARSVGKPLDEVLGHDDTAILEPDSARLAMGNDRLAIDLNQSVTVQEAWTVAGATRTYEATKAPYRDEKGEILGVISVSRDITPRREAEEAVRRQQALLRIAGRMARIGGWSLDVATQIATWSDEICEIHEVPAGHQPSLEDALQFYPPEYRERVARLVQNCEQNGTPFEFEFEMTTAKGRPIWVRSVGEAVRDEAGTIVGLQGAFQDITDRKHSEDRQRQLTEQLADTLKSIPDGFFTLDRMWQLRYVNTEAERLFGRSRDQVAGLSFWQAFPEALGTAFERECRRAVAEQVVVDFEDDFLPSATWCGVRAYPSQEGLAVYFRDVTASRSARMTLQGVEERQRFVSGLMESVDGLSDPTAVMVTSARMLAHYLRASRCTYGGAEEHGGAVVWADHAEGCASIVGPLPAEAFGQGLVSELAARRSVVVRDVAADARISDGAEALRALDIRAAVISPLGKDGSLRAALGVHQTTPRDWTHQEVALIEEVGARSWVVVERLRTQERLRRSESLFRTVVDSSWDVFQLVEPDGRIVYESPAATRVLGYQPEEMLGRHIREFVHPDDVPTLATWPTDVQPTDQRGGVTFRVHHKNGSWRWVESHEMNLLNHMDVRAIAITYRDVTDGRMAEQEVRKNEERFRLLSRATSDVVWEWDMVGGAHSWNDGITVLFEYEIEEVEPTREFWLSRLHPDDRVGILAVIDRAIESGAENWSGEYRFRRQDGTYVPVVDSGHIIRDGAGKPVRMLGGMKDLSERFRVQESLRLRDQAIQQLAQGIIITDAQQPDNPIVYVSDGFLRMTGYQADDLLGRNCRVLQGRETAEEPVRILRESIASGQPCTVELLNYRKDGRPFWNELSVRPVRDGRGNISHFVGIQSDVTGRRELETQLRQAQKMDAIGRLAGGVAHDFNNLLTVISGYSELLLGMQDIPPKVRDSALYISEAGERAASLTRQLLGFSRQSVLQPQVVDLNAVVSNSARMLRRVIGEDIALATVLEPKLGRVKVDPGQLDQILMNLAVNARDAMPRGGQLTLETSNVLVTDEYASTHLDCSPGEHVVLAITDTGIGMPPEVVARIFEPFYTTKAVGKGTGLGLAMVFGIVQQSGGCIHVYSEVDRGTTFKIYLPQIGDALSVQRMAESGFARGGTETVLLVEDDDQVRAMALMSLKMHGYQVLTARDGRDALAVAASHQGPVDLILTDVVMPNLSGPDLVRQLALRFPLAKILFMSGYTDDAVVRHGLIDASMAFIQKPYTPLVLARKVRQVLDT